MQTVGIVLPFFCGLALFCLFLMIQMTFLVQEGQVGVLKRFGRVLESRTLPRVLRVYHPGIHFKYPWDKVECISIKEQTIDLSGEGSGTMVMTADGTMLRLDSMLRVTCSQNHIYESLYAVKRPEEHMKGLFACLLRNEIANFDGPQSSREQGKSSFKKPTLKIGSYANLRSHRHDVNERIKMNVRSMIDTKYGLEFNGVDVLDILPPDELADALNSVINASAEAEKLYVQTEAQCEQKILAAEKGVSIAREKSKGVEAEIATMGDILEEMQLNENLREYVERRKSEVYGDSKFAYVRRK